jgi:hypothetical protein
MKYWEPVWRLFGDKTMIVAMCYTRNKGAVKIKVTLEQATKAQGP